MSELLVEMLNYMQIAPYQLTRNSYVCIRILLGLYKHYGAYFSPDQFERYFKV